MIYGTYIYICTAHTHTCIYIYIYIFLYVYLFSLRFSLWFFQLDPTPAIFALAVSASVSGVLADELYYIHQKWRILLYHLYTPASICLVVRKPISEGRKRCCCSRVGGGCRGSAFGGFYLIGRFWAPSSIWCDLVFVRSGCYPQPKSNRRYHFHGYLVSYAKACFSPPARWGLLDFMSVAWSSSSSSSPLLLLSLSSSSSCSTATRDPQCSLSDLNHDHPRPVFPAGPQPRPSTPSVPCRTSTTTIHAKRYAT